jgi:tRNA pseudouridine38-40 synthase
VSKKNVCGLIAYEGTRYLGWQKTSEGPSIQQALESALAILLREEALVEGASRTDAGVHAHGQVVNFFAPEDVDLGKLLRGMNALLPKDIVVHSLKLATPSFHPTLDTLAKEYHYEVVFGSTQPPFLRDFSWHYPKKLDLAAMRRAADALLGIHDFSSFCNEIKELEVDPVCHLQKLTIDEIAPGHIKIRAIGNRFLYRMVRNLVGTLVYVGCGKTSADAMTTILKAKDRTLAGMTAPAKGLFLHRAYYDLAQ